MKDDPDWCGSCVALICLAIFATVIFVAAHFIGKYW